MKLAWWLPAVLVVGLGLELSAVQVSLAGARDLRAAALRTTFTLAPGYVGDPWPSVVAARRLHADSRAPIYDRDLSVGSAFIYPPIAAALYRPLATLLDAAARRALAIASHALFVVVWLELVLLVGGARRPRPAEVAGVLAALALFYPILHAVELNQSTMLIAALLGGAWLALDRARPRLAGALFAFAFAIKPQLALVLPLLVWHAPRFVVAALATGGALLAASLVYAGVANHIDYVTRVLPLLSRGYAYYANQSWNGLCQRLFVDTDLGFFALPPRAPWATGCAAVASAATWLAALGCARRWRGRALPPAWLFGFAWLAVTVSSPISWQHHYVPALFGFALFYRSWRDEPRLRRPSIVVPVALAFAAMASYFEVRQLHGAAAQLVVSYVFFGALVLLVTLARAVALMASRSDDKSETDRAPSPADSRARATLAAP